jgi:hypothetical protein
VPTCGEIPGLLRQRFLRVDSDSNEGGQSIHQDEIRQGSVTDRHAAEYLGRRKDQVTASQVTETMPLATMARWMKKNVSSDATFVMPGRWGGHWSDKARKRHENDGDSESPWIAAFGQRACGEPSRSPAVLRLLIVDRPSQRGSPAQGSQLSFTQGVHCSSRKTRSCPVVRGLQHRLTRLFRSQQRVSSGAG